MTKYFRNIITYIQSGDSEAWVDWPERRGIPLFMSKDSVQCVQCKGHGGWNLLLGAYPLNEQISTPDSRHAYSHMKTTCHVCAGHGWISDNNRSCVHEYRLSHVVNHRTQFNCVKCKHYVLWDIRRKT